MSEAGTDPKNLEGLTPLQRRRLIDREEWKAFWQVQKIEAQGNILPTIRYYGWRLADIPVTWFREKIVEPLRDRNRLPYYQRKLSRAPEIDQCGVNDYACRYEANEQFRLDKLIDFYIMETLRGRVDRCLQCNSHSWKNCAQAIWDMEETEYNWFVKYGELGSEGDVADCYMKQKHRLIWERRHPEIMAERQRQYELQKEKLKKGEFDMSFWKKGLFWMDKKNYEPSALYEWELSKPPNEADKPLSKDWQYYKKVSQDPEFDKAQGKQSKLIPFSF